MRTGDLRAGKVISCGCYRNNKLIKQSKTHGMKKTRFYRIWDGMKRRCLNTFDSHYSKYGGRGIKICERWIKFENFRDDMLKAYLKHCLEFGEKNTSIDRINNNGNYEIKNCKWATKSEQQSNKNPYKFTKPRKINVQH